MLINSLTHSQQIPTVVECKVENCLKCVETSGSICNACQSDYVVVDGQCKDKDSEDNESNQDNGLSDIEIAGE